MPSILNLTAQEATTAQLSAGVMDLHEAERQTLIELLTVDTLPDPTAIYQRVTAIVGLARTGSKPGTVMIGGEPWLMARLEAALHLRGYRVVYSFKNTGFVPA